MSRTPALQPWMRDALRSRIVERIESLRGELGTAMHPANNGFAVAGATAGEDFDVAVASVRRDADELQALEESLARLASPEFGLCADCNKPIGWARLQAAPYAGLCRRCEEFRESVARTPIPRL